MIKEKYTINSNRINYLLKLYNLKDQELLDKLYTGKKKISLDLLNNRLFEQKEVDLSFLKKLDKIFDKGLVWYISKREIDEEGSSIFLRKDKFNSDLNFNARKIINRFEEQKLDVQLLGKLINYNLDRQINNYSISNNIKDVKEELIKKFNNKTEELISKKIIKPKIKTEKEYLERLIRIIELFNIFVFEFIEHKKKEKSNFSGFFMKPNIIVIKREKYLRREIFTLMHEFAHYLLSTEEIDQLEDNNQNKSEVENWCNDFAFAFLINDYHREFNDLTLANKENNYYEEEINNLYNKTYISKTAFYTRLLKENKISSFDYNNIYLKIQESIKKEEINKKLKEQEIAEITKQDKVKHFGISKPIQSNLFIDILRYNYFEGNIDQGKICKYLKIKGEKFNDFIY